MALYNNIIFWDYDIAVGEYVTLYRNPFSEVYADPIFKVLSINRDTWIGTVEVVASDDLSVGQVLDNFSLRGLKRIKFTA